MIATYSPDIDKVGKSQGGCRAAFFDLDGTLVVGQTTLLLVKFLNAKGLLSRAFLVGTVLWFLGYKTGVIRLTEASRERGARVFAGLTVEEVEGLAASFVDEVLMPRLNAKAMSALAGHLGRGDRVAVISAALEPVVRGFCLRLGVSEYASTPVEIRDGRYTGKFAGPSPSGAEKARMAHLFLERWGVAPADAWAYGDHESDLPLLSMVGHPVAVNPRPALLRSAEQAGWAIMR